MADMNGLAPLFYPVERAFYYLFVKTGILWVIILVGGIGVTVWGALSNPESGLTKVTATYQIVYYEGYDDPRMVNGVQTGWAYTFRGETHVIRDEKIDEYGNFPTAKPGSKLTFWFDAGELQFADSRSQIKTKLDYTSMSFLLAAGIMAMALGIAGITYREIYKRKHKPALTTPA